MPVEMERYRDRITVADGAWGTQLQKRGLQAGQCPELMNLTRPELVRAVAAEYVAAGAEIILTNSFGGNGLSLARHGLEDKVAQINAAAARLSKQAAGDSAAVFASIGPTGKMLITGEVDERQLYEVFCQQAEALAAGGADAFVIETMTDLGEARAAYQAVRDRTDLPVVVSFSYDSGPEGTATMMGTTAEQVVEALEDWGVDGVGANCGLGVDNYVKVARIYRARTNKLIWIKPNNGMPELIDGKAVYTQTPEAFAAGAEALIDAGANIIGGCCGTTPDHIRALAEMVARHR